MSGVSAFATISPLSITSKQKTIPLASYGKGTRPPVKSNTTLGAQLSPFSSSKKIPVKQRKG